MQKRGFWLFFLLISALSVSAAFPVSEEEAVAAIAKPSVAKIEVACTYKIEVERPYLQGDEILAGETVGLQEKEDRSGSGFVVSKNGYVVTNAHVILPYEGEEALDLFIPMLVDIYDLKNVNADKVRDYFKSHFRVVKSETSRLIVRLPAYMPSSGVIGKMHPAEIKRVSRPFPGLDLALLKIDGTNLPALKLGSTAHLGGGNRVILIGFPAAAELAGRVFDATVTSGIVSGVKETSEGVKLVQIDAAAETGSSGGPALDSSGLVVGVDVASWARKQGFNYIIPAEEVKEFLSDAFVLPDEGTTRKVYERALVHFWNKRYDNAIEDFQAVRDIYPDHPYAPNYLLQGRLAQEEKRPKEYNMVFFGIGAFLVILVIVLFFIVVRERHELEVLRR